MRPRVGTRGRKQQKRWMGTASDPLERAARGRTGPLRTSSASSSRFAAALQGGPETARLRSTPYRSLTVNCCCSCAACPADGSVALLVDVVDGVQRRFVDGLGWHVVRDLVLRPRAQGRLVRSRHRAPLPAPPQRQAAKPGTVCSETEATDWLTE